MTGSLPAADDGGTVALGDVSPEERLLLGLGDPPAYLRRGLSVEDAEARVYKRCETARDEMLYAVRLRLRFWNRLVQDSKSVREAVSSVAAESATVIGGQVFAPGEPTMAPAPVGWGFFASKHWRAFVLAVADFNARWKRFIETLPLDDLHRTIDGYNRYYVLEKECAVRSALTARRGFVPLSKPTAADLLVRFSALPVPPADYRG